MKPWGEFSWLSSWYPDRDWVVICCTGFEERCMVLPRLVQNANMPIRGLHSLRISDPENEHTTTLEQLTEANQLNLLQRFPKAKVIRGKLLDPAQHWARFVDELCSAQEVSILLDITSLPKRVGLFLLKQFYGNKNVRDLLVSYAPTTGYREGYLAKDVLPPSALPGYGLSGVRSSESTVIVSVGYSSFDLGDILQQTAPSNVFFVMPFPPASPSFRRNWKLLKVLTERLAIEKPEVERINAHDAFAVTEWVRGHLDTDKTTTMLALGPKPHSLGLAFAQLLSGGCAELVYPQPQTYHPEYTAGDRRNSAGEPSLIGYGVIRDSVRVFDIH